MKRFLVCLFTLSIIIMQNAVTTCVQEFERILLTAGKSIVLNADKQFNVRLLLHSFDVHELRHNCIADDTSMFRSPTP